MRVLGWFFVVFLLVPFVFADTELIFTGFDNDTQWNTYGETVLGVAAPVVNVTFNGAVQSPSGPPFVPYPNYPTFSVGGELVGVARGEKKYVMGRMLVVTLMVVAGLAMLGAVRPKSSDLVVIRR